MSNENKMQANFKSLPGNENWTVLSKMSKVENTPETHLESLGFSTNNGQPRFKLGGFCSNAFSSMDMAEPDPFPSVTNSSTSFVVLNHTSLEEVQESCLANFNSIKEKTLSIDYNSIVQSINPDDVQKKLSELLQENAKLKETLVRNNEAMKQQFNSLATWQERVLSIHNDHKKKFAETRELINQLKKENSKLKTKIATGVKEELSFNMCSLKKQDTTESVKSNDTAVLDEIRALKEELNETKDNYIKLSQVVEKKVSLSQSSIDSCVTEESIQKSTEECDEEEKGKNPVYIEENLYQEIEKKILDLHEEKCDETNLVQQSEEKMFPHKQQLVRNMKQYNEQLQSLLELYTAERLRFRLVQESMFRIETLLNNLNLSTIKKDLAPDLQKKIEYGDSEIKSLRFKLLNDVVKYGDENVKMLEMQKLFQKIFWDYSALVNELEMLEEEKFKIRAIEDYKIEHEEKMRAFYLEKETYKSNNKRLNSDLKFIDAKLKSMNVEHEHFNEEIKKLQEENKKLKDEKMLFDRHSKINEAREKTLQMENKQLRSKFDEQRKVELTNMELVIHDLRMQMEEMKNENEATLFAMNTQLELYKSDFEAELTAKNEMAKDRNSLISQVERLSQEHQNLQREVERLNNFQGASDVPRQNENQFESRYCSICHRYTNPGEYHGWGSCQPEFD